MSLANDLGGQNPKTMREILIHFHSTLNLNSFLKRSPRLQSQFISKSWLLRTSPYRFAIVRLHRNQHSSSCSSVFFSFVDSSCHFHLVFYYLARRLHLSTSTNLFVDATFTAFLSTIVTRYDLMNPFVAFALPSLIGIPLLIFWQQKIEKSFTKR